MQPAPQPAAASPSAQKDMKGAGRGGRDRKKDVPSTASDKGDTEFTVLDGGAFPVLRGDGLCKSDRG